MSLAKKDRPALAKIDVFSVLITRRQALTRQLSRLAEEPRFNPLAIARCEARLELIDELLKEMG